MVSYTKNNIKNMLDVIVNLVGLYRFMNEIPVFVWANNNFNYKNLLNYT